jgi:hypothetical protein
MPLLNFHIIVAEINLYAGTRGFGVHAPNSVKPLARIHSGRSRTRDERVSIPHRVMREHRSHPASYMLVDFPLAENHFGKCEWECVSTRVVEKEFILTYNWNEALRCVVLKLKTECVKP